jgi:hypothetical protein
MRVTSETLKEEFLKRLSRLHRGLLLSRKKWEVENLVNPNQYFKTYEEYIDKNFFDLPRMKELLQRFYEGALSIEERRLSERLNGLIRRERREFEGREERTCPVFFLEQDTTKFVGEMVRAFKETIEWIREESSLEHPPDKSSTGKKRRGRPPDPEVTERVAILHRAGIKKPSDLYDKQKLRSAFAALEKARLVVPRFDTDKWLEFTDEPERSEELKKVRETLRLNLIRNRL